MQSVGTRHTGPELTVRSLLHRLGYRFRLHGRDLPGSPDIVFRTRHKVIFVHGCYWHGHGCPKGKLPKSRSDYWVPKIAKNRERDMRNDAALRAIGWESLTVWQCETKDFSTLAAQVIRFLGEARKIPIDFSGRSRYRDQRKLAGGGI